MFNPLNLISKIIKGSNQKELDRIQKIVKNINYLEKNIEKLEDADFPKKTNNFVDQIKNGKKIEEILPEAFALVREASKRTRNERHFDVQLIGGIVLNEGKIAEMRTGEGKTLTIVLAAYLNALNEKGVHIVTVNDYLAKRDSEWMGKVFNYLGVSTGCITNELNDIERKRNYKKDITYGTNNEFGFDYLRDNMAVSSEQLVQGELFYSVIDEVDSILVDEARTPLIISGKVSDSTKWYSDFTKIVKGMKKDIHYEICLLYTSPSPRDQRGSRMPSSA